MAKQKVFKIFISHSHKDNQFGIKLAQDLKRKLGNNVKVWYDADGGLNGGDRWWTKILEELVSSSVFIVIVSPDAMASKWVDDEISIAWAHKNSQQGKLIIPLLYQKCKVREDLSTLQLVSFLTPNSYEAALDELTKRLEKYKDEFLISPSSPSSTSPKRKSDNTLGPPRPDNKQVNKLLRRKIIASKFRGQINSEERKVSNSLRSVYQSTARRQAQIEANERAENSRIEFHSLPLWKRTLDKPIVFENGSQNKERQNNSEF